MSKRVVIEDLIEVAVTGGAFLGVLYLFAAAAHALKTVNVQVADLADSVARVSRSQS